MITKDFTCRIVRTEWATPSVLLVTFEPSVKFSYEPGQFITWEIPGAEAEPERRCYTLTTAPEEALQNGYQILVKMIPGGKGSRFLQRLRAGDLVHASGPFGDFHYRTLTRNRSVCFITTSTGLAPIRAIVGSSQFGIAKPERVTLLTGVRHEKEILFPGFFESQGIETIPCVTFPSSLANGLWGRVTDYLERNRERMNWLGTDFYVVGNQRMVNEVLYQLKFKRNVPMQNIFVENFRSHLLVPPVSDINVIQFPVRGLWERLKGKKAA
jgi:ferredoxin-NADP reductase